MDAAAVGRGYFEAIQRRDTDAMAAFWAADGRDDIHDQAYVRGPRGVQEYFDGLFAAIPDFTIEILDVVAETNRVAVHWSLTGTFGGTGSVRGIEPTGDRLKLRGVDFLVIGEDDLIVSNDAYSTGLSFAEQIGLIPPPGTPLNDRVTKAFNARTRLKRHVTALAPERVADGVWLVRGGWPRRDMNVFLIEEPGGGVTMFDGGISGMGRALESAAAPLGRIRRIVLGHGHVDHRGAAPEIDAPVFCHADNVADTEGAGGLDYFDFSKAPLYSRRAYPMLLRHWDGGPVKVAGTVEEGEEIAGFEVVPVPGHAPGMIALHRKRDGLALTTDSFYVLDPFTGRKGHTRVPHETFNRDTAQARESLRALAALDLQTAWPGHQGPLTGNIRADLERAADG